ncbi:MAG: biotin--[acetyl-CoA-carboxylase] ligase, partial [Rhodothermales bacterium]
MSHSMLLPLAQDTRALLKTRHFGRSMRSYQAVDSTNTAALQWASDGAPEGSVILANVQTAGRGRQGRSWHSAAGQNLTFSVILRPSLPPARLSLITLGAGVAVAEAVEALTAPLSTTIKWPNDVLLEGTKCCGMLLESTLDETGTATVILGIGLNVNQSAFPETLESKATSLLLQTGRHTPRPPLLADLL